MRHTGSTPSRQQTSVPHVTPVSSNPDAIASNDFLDFGMNNPSVTEDCRRDIVKQMEKLNQNCAAVEKSITLEQNLAKSLQKDKMYSAKEQAGLLRDGLRLADQYKMNQQMLRNVDATLSSETGMLLDLENDDDKNVKLNDKNEIAAAASSGKSLPASRKSSAAKQEMFEKNFHDGESAFATLRDCIQKKAELEASISAGNDKLQRARDELETAKTLAENRRKEIHDEKQRLMHLETTLAASKKEEVAVATKLDALKKKLADKKGAGVAARSAQAKQIDNAKARLTTLKKKAHDIDAATAKTNAFSQDINDQLTAYKKLKDERDGHKQAIEAARAERNGLFTKQEEIGAALAAAKMQLDEKVKLIHALETKFEVELEPLQAANNQMEIDNVGKDVDYKNLVEMVKGLRESAKTAETNEEAKLMDEETEQLVKHKEEMDTKLETLKTGIEEAEAALVKVREEKTQYESAVLRIKELKEQAATLGKEIEALKEAAASKRASADARIAMYRKLNILREGAVMLKKTKKAELELEQNPAAERTLFN
ncbi:hypothetical protein MPSEU_000923200 [Mayamaea pseudoterrestris]|nr:hypothetical protein MPSEU_000923200 [Mayamaea pseudoterrestris]